MPVNKEKIPLFPLPKVLFPNMVLPLHIFEPRYKEMVSRCINQQLEFGVILDSELEKNGVGTSSNIRSIINKYEDGRYDIIAIGNKRFKVKRILNKKQYFEGELEFFDDDASTLQTDQEKMSAMINLFRLHIRKIGVEPQLCKQLEFIVESLNQEQEISYIIAQTCGLEISEMQKLLIFRSGEKRIHFLTEKMMKFASIQSLAKRLSRNSSFDPMNN